MHMATAACMLVVHARMLAADRGPTLSQFCAPLHTMMRSLCHLMALMHEASFATFVQAEQRLTMPGKLSVAFRRIHTCSPGLAIRHLSDIRYYTMQSLARVFTAKMQSCHLHSAWPLQLRTLLLFGWLLLGGSLSFGAAAADYSYIHHDGPSCELGSLVRPVILVHGYGSSFLYGSSANYTIEWVDPEDTAPGNEGRGVGDLDLPLTWDETSLTQDTTDVGPESFDGDDTPSLFLPDGSLIPIVEGVRSWST